MAGTVETVKRLTAAAAELTKYIKSKGVQPKSTLQRKIGPTYVAKPYVKPSAPAVKRYATRTTPGTYVKTRVGAGSAQPSYAGKFKRPTTRTTINKYQARGATVEKSIFGTVSMSHCAYLGAMSVLPKNLAKDVGLAFARMIMKKHFHHDYTGELERMWPFNASVEAENPASLRVYWEGMNAADSSTGFVEYAFNTPSATLQNFANWFATNVFLSSAFGAGGNVLAGQRQIRGYQFYTDDAITATINFVIPGGIHLLNNQYIDCFSTSELTLQNTTVSNGGSLLSDVVDTNPIVGRLYKLSSLLPELHNASAGNLNTTGPLSGADVWKELQMADSDNNGFLSPNTNAVGSWRAVPDAAMFKNCKYSTKVHMQPGATKKHSIGFKYNGLLTNLISGFKSYTDSSGQIVSSYDKGSFGTAMLFAFSKQIRTGDPKVTVGWTMRVTSGAVFGGQKAVVFQKAARHGFTAIDNIPTL
jgi:hypothetical protein